MRIVHNYLTKEGKAERSYKILSKWLKYPTETETTIHKKHQWPNYSVNNNNNNNNNNCLLLMTDRELATRILLIGQIYVWGYRSSGFSGRLVISGVSEWTSTFYCKDRAFILLVPPLPLKIKAPRPFETSGTTNPATSHLSENCSNLQVHCSGNVASSVHAGSAVMYKAACYKATGVKAARMWGLTPPCI